MSRIQLHGFTRDQDIFETSDPTEDDEVKYEDDCKSSSVQQVDVNVQSSYEKFKDKVLEGKTADFSDKLGRPVQCGFRTEPEDYEMAPTDREPETLMQRYHRLKLEVSELLSDVGRVKEAQQSSEKLLDVSPVDLMEDVQLLQQQLHGLQLDRVLGTQLLVAPEHPYQTVLLRDLKSQIEALKSSKDPSQEKQPTYEVYTRTEAAKFTHLSKLSEVEERLARLENLVGTEDTTVSTVAGGLDAEQKDLSTAVLNLQAKVALLDTTHVNTIGAQLQGLLNLLEQIDTQEKTKGDSPEKQAKVSEALEIVNRISAIAPLVPDLITRLHTLKELHERAAQFAGSVTYMTDSQGQLSKQITTLQSLVAKLQESLQQNLSTVQSNFASLESRISTLQNRS